MATKRIAKSAINWAAVAERVPNTQKNNFFAFKTKSDGYLKRVLSNPEKAPTIDWNVYKTKIPAAAMVDTFQKNYEALSIPYPPDTYTKQIDEQEKNVKAEIESFKKQSAESIKNYESQLAHLQNLLPFDQMTMEDFKDSYPDLALDPLKKPTFWPHDADEQMDYRDKGHPLHGTSAHH